MTRLLDIDMTRAVGIVDGRHDVSGCVLLSPVVHYASIIWALRD